MNLQKNKILSVAKKIKEMFKPKKIVLFGSYAQGKQKPGSDVDLLVIMNTALPVREQAFLIRREIREFIPIDIIVRTPQQVRERIRLGDFFIKQIMQNGVFL